MNKITVEDIKKELPLVIRIKASSKRAIALPKRIFNSVKNFYHNDKAKLENNITEETKTELLRQKIEKLDNKRAELRNLAGQMEQQDEFRIGNKNYYLEAVKEQIRKLDNKKIKRTKKGLGKFALAKITLSNYLASRKAKASLKKSVKQQLKIEEEENKIIKELEEKATEKLERENKIKSILMSNPELVEYYTSLKEEEKKEKTR